jgi:hypothetical protein
LPVNSNIIRDRGKNRLENLSYTTKYQQVIKTNNRKLLKLLEFGEKIFRTLMIANPHQRRASAGSKPGFTYWILAAIPRQPIELLMKYGSLGLNIQEENIGFYHFGTRKNH